MDLRQIESAVAVADELHFGRAADRLFVSTSVVSHHVSRLEHELGVRLFERSTRNVRITAAGQSVLTHARAVLAAVNAMKCLPPSQADHEGEPTIAYRPSADELVATLTADLRREHPNTEVVLLVMASIPRGYLHPPETGAGAGFAPSASAFHALLNIMCGSTAGKSGEDSPTSAG